MCNKSAVIFFATFFYFGLAVEAGVKCDEAHRKAGHLTIRSEPFSLTDAEKATLANLYATNHEFKKVADEINQKVNMLRILEIASENYRRYQISWDEFLDFQGISRVINSASNVRKEIIVLQMKLMAHLDPEQPIPELVKETFVLMTTINAHGATTAQDINGVKEFLIKTYLVLNKTGLTLNSYLQDPKSLNSLKDVIRKMNENNNYSLWLPR